jgi:hypothetical protein
MPRMPAAARGARVTGVDPAPRLPGVAREEATARCLDATPALGEASALPLADGQADVVLSVFGVVSPPIRNCRGRAGARAARGGRIVLSAGIPKGAMSQACAPLASWSARPLARRWAAVFPWHERDALAELFAPLGFEVTN